MEKAEIRRHVASVFLKGGGQTDPGSPPLPLTLMLHVERSSDYVYWHAKVCLNEKLN